MKSALRLRVHDIRALAVWPLLAALFGAFAWIHPRGVSPDMLATWSNQGVALAFVAVGQTIVVLSRGIDLSIGPAMALANCAASVLMNGSPEAVAWGTAVVAALGIACGFANGLVVVIGRIQPIVATLATGAVFTGLALTLQPTPGGSIDEAASDALTGVVAGWLPASLILLVALVGAVWLPVRASMLGRTIRAVGSAEQAAFMSGLPVPAARIAAFTLGGLFAALGGIFLGLQTLSGDPSIGASYTLNAVAAVVVGGTSLAGGVGSVAGSIAGAFALRTVGSLIFFLGLSPMAQPLFEGLVLALVVAAGATRLIGIRNRLEVIR